MPTIIMKTTNSVPTPPSSNSFGRGVLKGITFITSELHFAAQTTADIIAHSEGYLASKLTDISKSDAIAHRRATTKRSQQDLKKVGFAMKTALKNRYALAPKTV